MFVENANHKMIIIKNVIFVKKFQLNKIISIMLNHIIELKRLCKINFEDKKNNKVKQSK